MTRSPWTRPAPGTTDLLEVLDRALTGGIVIGAERRINVVTLAPSSRRARLVVTATETYLRHPVPEPSTLPAPFTVDQVEERARRSG